MKKIILILVSILLICFLIPILFTANFKFTNAPIKNEENTISTITEYNYTQYGTINLLHADSGQIEEVSIDEYLVNVVSAEMPANFEIEALKAQAVTARTYTIYKAMVDKRHENADICDSHLCCQAWISKEERFEKWEEEKRQSNWSKIEEAVNSTKGRIITYNSQVINALFHSNSGGKTEVPINVWSSTGNYPYLQAVETSGEDAYTQYSSEVILTKAEVFNKIKKTYGELEIDFAQENPIEITEYTETGRIKTIKFGNISLSGVEARSIFGLRSTNFTFVIEEENIKFKVIGYGHGVGMSQTGADALAKQGRNHEEIIHHYYKDIEIRNI